MLGSLFLHPDMVLPLWRRALVGARCPARLPFKLDQAPQGAPARDLKIEETALSPLAVLTRFELPNARPAAPRPDVLLIPPMAGGFPFILRDVAAWLLDRARIHVIEWLNVRECPGAGGFDVDDQIRVVRDALRRIGRPAHVWGFCQAGYAALAAAALAAADTTARADAPRSIALFAAPLAPHLAPSPVSEKLALRNVDLFKSRRGGRRDAETGVERGVYPAEVQLTLVMNTIAAQSPDTHEFSRLMLRDEGDNPEAVSFLEMATSIMDLPWEHFRDNIERLYLRADPLADRLRYQDRPVPLEALRQVPILTLEGVRDSLVAPGQCAAALDAVPAAAGVSRARLVVEKAGHFGLFYGDRWRAETAPAAWDLVQRGETEADGGRRASA